MDMKQKWTIESARMSANSEAMVSGLYPWEYAGRSGDSIRSIFRQFERNLDFYTYPDGKALLGRRIEFPCLHSLNRALIETVSEALCDAGIQDTSGVADVHDQHYYAFDLCFLRVFCISGLEIIPAFRLGGF